MITCLDTSEGNTIKSKFRILQENLVKRKEIQRKRRFSYQSDVPFVLEERVSVTNWFFSIQKSLPAFHTLPPRIFPHTSKQRLSFIKLNKQILCKMRHLDPTICTLCMYHSLNVCLCDTWTEDMARSRSMTLRDTNIPRISLCFCHKKFDRCICTYQRLFFVDESVISWNIRNDFFSASLFQLLAWLDLALLARIFTIIHENLGESCEVAAVLS